MGADDADQQGRIEQGRIEQVRARFRAGAPQAMTDEDHARLDLIVRGLGAARFPATRDALLDAARPTGDDELLVELRSLPDDARYASLDDLLLALGVGMAGRRSTTGRSGPDGIPGHRSPPGLGQRRAS
ncbi:MAG TPA: DUF2795 domain-containing protein [Kineosporiaceae bacterium]